MWQRIRKPVIVAFLLWHFSAVLLWLSPDCPLRTELIGPFISYLNFFELWQGWSVFEKPRMYNGYLTALIKYKDGQEKVWEFPRMEKLGLMEKMFKEKYRRWTNDCVSDPDKPYLWPDAARYIARLNNNKTNPPVSLAIIRHWTWILPPDRGINQPISQQDDGTEVLYSGKIAMEDLQ